MSAYAALVTKAKEAQLPFLVIGGNAVIAYGYPRQTNDFDLLVCTRHRYLWDALIRESGYFPKNYHAVFHNYKSELPEHHPIDLMLVDPATFERFEEGAMETVMEHMQVRIPALLHLLSLKLHAERSSGDKRLGRDFNDILMLMQINKVNLADPAFQEILVKFGNEQIHRRLQLALEKSASGF